MSISLPIQLNFIAFAIPGLIAAVALSFVPVKMAYYKNSHSERNEEIVVESDKISAL
ncbi:hypothetical protein ACQKKK_15645 [Peribacillus sp. NPDC006672]|uniref:hypothetical protein n=1 Tax=Peribacillus sp. NPDC006672 TaxID=3390606 RepID=UPI003CFD88C8